LLVHSQRPRMRVVVAKDDDKGLPVSCETEIPDCSPRNNAEHQTQQENVIETSTLNQTAIVGHHVDTQPRRSRADSVRTNDDYDDDDDADADDDDEPCDAAQNVATPESASFTRSSVEVQHQDQESRMLGTPIGASASVNVASSPGGNRRRSSDTKTNLTALPVTSAQLSRSADSSRKIASRIQHGKSSTVPGMYVT
jgi:hypothetical protein